MRLTATLPESLSDGFRNIRAAQHISEGDAGTDALRLEASTVKIDPKVQRRDLTDLGFVTLDPATSTDLDQAFFLSRENENLVLLYAIADIGAFVARGSALEVEAWTRGVTVYAPDGSVPLYPRVLSSQRASLLPDGPRPAIVLTVVVSPEGGATLRLVERAWVRSRAKLAYEAADVGSLPAELVEFAARVSGAERARGAFRVDRPEQQVVSDTSAPGGLGLRFAPRLATEDQNAALSLAANLAAAQFMLAAGLGLFRVMDDPDERELLVLRHLAASSGLRWPPSQGLHDLIGQLDLHKAPDLAFALALRRAGGGARYAFYRSSDATTTGNDAALGEAMSKPWHAAIAASYAHVTAPMRRLADRYVLELLLAQFEHDQAAVVELSALLRSLPSVMDIAERRAARVERDCVELIEAGLLAPLIGSVLPATVIDAGHDGWLVQLDQPAVLWRIRPKPGQHAQYGDAVKVRVVMSTTKPVDLQME